MFSLASSGTCTEASSSGRTSKSWRRQQTLRADSSSPDADSLVVAARGSYIGTIYLKGIPNDEVERGWNVRTPDPRVRKLRGRSKPDAAREAS